MRIDLETIFDLLSPYCLLTEIQGWEKALLLVSNQLGLFEQGYDV